MIPPVCRPLDHYESAPQWLSEPLVQLRAPAALVARGRGSFAPVGAGQAEGRINGQMQLPYYWPGQWGTVFLEWLYIGKQETWSTTFCRYPAQTVCRSTQSTMLDKKGCRPTAALHAHHLMQQAIAEQLLRRRLAATRGDCTLSMPSAFMVRTTPSRGLLTISGGVCWGKASLNMADEYSLPQHTDGVIVWLDSD